MKRILKITLLGLLACFLALLLFIGAQSIRLNWWLSSGDSSLEELSPDQKAEDMGFLLDLTRRISPAEVVWESTGMENPLLAPQNWIEKARNTASNREFVDLVLQFLVHIGQGGHAFLAYDANFNPVTSLVSDIPRNAFATMPQWASFVSQLPWYAHADLDIVYQNGLYLLQKDAQVGEALIPAGSIVAEVEHTSVDTYVMQQQYRAHLRYDPAYQKFFIYPLLTIDPGPDRPGWEVSFRLPDNTIQTLLVEKSPGYLPHRPDESSAVNTRCLNLGDGVLYIKMLNFYKINAAQDALNLQQCFASGQYQKAIFDVRGNNGGEIWSYMDNVMAPLTDIPIRYDAIVANKESFYNWYGWRFGLYQMTNDNELSDAITHIEKIETIHLPPFGDQGWRVVRVTRRIEPAAQSFNFQGQAYVIADNNTLSAGDSFAAAMQKTGLGKVIGANTTGWGQAAQAKMLYGLPNSGILFYLDSELVLNSDLSIDNYAGVTPDVFLSRSSYPTPYPLWFDRASILADPWVQWALAD